MPGPNEDLPPCLIFIDQEGRLWHQGAEMIHAGINSLLLEHLSLDERGRYVIDYRGQRCQVEVEDTAIVVGRVSLSADGESLTLSLSDGTREALDPKLLWVAEDNAVYTRVREGRLPSRFLRQAYYQLAEHIQESENGFALSLGGRLYPLRPGRPG